MTDSSSTAEINLPELSDDTLWDATDVARWLKVSRSWVYQAAESGKLPSLKIGGLLRFDPAVVKAWALTGGGKVVQMVGRKG